MERKLNEGPVLNPYTNRPYSVKFFELLEKRRTLPVWHRKAEFLTTLAEYQTMIIVGEPGSVKTTQIPQFVVEAGYTSNRKQVVCTQTRRAAAMSVSRRVADEMDVAIGDEVGYDCDCGLETVLKYVMDGTLVQEAMTDRLLGRYRVIILDEAHERTLATDVLFGLLKKVMSNDRPDLKLVVMSANLEAAEKFLVISMGLHACTCIEDCTLCSVEILYTQEPQRDYMEGAVSTVLGIHTSEPPGNILLFLTGNEEILEACRRITRAFHSLGDKVGPVEVVPLYSTSPPAVQQKLFDAAPPPAKEGGRPGRKIVVSSSIAETSLSIDGIVYVVDPAFVKQKVYDPRSGAELGVLSPISKASAEQRSNCAG